MKESNCCKDKGYFDKWERLKTRLKGTRNMLVIIGDSAEDSAMIKVLSAVLNDMKELEENAK